MNINHKIKEIAKGGIPGYNRKINEIVKCVNWLLGMRVINGVGSGVTESSTGPVIDLSTIQANQQQPWAIDPNGSSTGWTLMTYLDASGNLNDGYVWTGIAFNNRPCS